MKSLQGYIQFSRRRLILALLTVIVFILAYIMLYHLQWRTLQRTTEEGEVTDQVVDGYSDAALLRQSFFIHEKCELNQVRVRIASLDGVTVPGITVWIQTKLGDTLFSQEIPVDQLQAGEYLMIDTGGITLSGRDRYYLVFSCTCPNPETDVKPSLQLCKKNKVNDILYLNGFSIEDQTLDAVYDYTTVRMGLHEIFVCFVMLFVFLGVFLLKAEYAKHVPPMLVIFIGFCMWIQLWRKPLGINLGNYDGSVMQRGVIVLMVLLCAVGAVCFAVRTAGTDMLEKRKENTHTKHSEKWRSLQKAVPFGVAGLVMLLVFLAQIYVAQKLYQQNGWDVEYVYNLAKSLVADHTFGENAWYLALFPNNRALATVYYMIMKLFGTSSDQVIYWHLVVFNILSVDVAIILLYQIARKLYTRLAAVCAFCFGLILFGFSGWIVVPYTDTIPMWIPMLQALLYISWKETDKVWIRRIILALMGMLAIWGYYLKPQCIIVMIAIVIAELCRMAAGLYQTRNLTGRRKRRTEKERRSAQKDLLKGCLHNVLFTGAGMLAAACIFQAAFGALSDDKLDYSGAVPMSHFLMMGAAENGSLGSFDFDSGANYTYRFATTQEKNAACWKRFHDMLQNYGFSGYMTHLWEKAHWVLGDGSFAWMGEGSFFAGDFHADQIDEVMHRYRELYFGAVGGYDNTKRMKHFGRVSAVWFFVLLLCLFPLQKARRGECKAVLYLAAVGCIAFTMLFEGRPRYLILYLPFFCILAGATVNWVVSGISCKRGGSPS